MSGGITQTNLAVQPSGQTTISTTATLTPTAIVADNTHLLIGNPNNNTVNLATVTLGKTGRLWGGFINVYATGAGSVDIKVNGRYLAVVQVAAAGSYTIPIFFPFGYISVAATQTITATSSGATAPANVTIIYDEV